MRDFDKLDIEAIVLTSGNRRFYAYTNYMILRLLPELGRRQWFAAVIQHCTSTTYMNYRGPADRALVPLLNPATLLQIIAKPHGRVSSEFGFESRKIIQPEQGNVLDLVE